MYGDRVCITYMYTVRMYAHLQIAMYCSVNMCTQKIPAYDVKCKSWKFIRATCARTYCKLQDVEVYTYHSCRTQIIGGQTITKLSDLHKENANFDLE